MSLEQTIEYLQNVETSLKNGERAPKLKNLLLPLSVLIPIHIDKLKEGGYLMALQESIKEYIALYDDTYDADEEHKQEKADVKKALDEIMNMKASESAMCTGPDKTMVPHKADPTIYEDYGLCSDCVMKHGEYKGAKPKKKKKVIKDDILLKNISKCIEDVTDKNDRQIIKSCIKIEEAVSGEQIYQKLKSVSMSKTPGNWTKLVDKIKRDVNKLHSAYGVQAVVYVHNKRVQKLEKIGKSRSKCKIAGKTTQEDGQVINTFEVAENHLTEILMSLQIEEMPTQYEAYLAAKVMNSLSQVGLAKLKGKKEEDKFINTDDFLAKFETWMDNLEKGEEESDEKDESGAESNADDDQDKDLDTPGDVSDGFQEAEKEKIDEEEESIERPQKKIKYLQEKDFDKIDFIQDEMFDGVTSYLNGNENVTPAVMDLQEEFTTQHGLSQESIELFNVPATFAHLPNVRDELSVQPQFQYVSDSDASLMDSFTNVKKEKQQKKKANSSPKDIF